MPRVLHPRDYRLYVSRIEGGRGLASIEDSVGTSIQRHEDYIEKRGGRLIIATRNHTNDTRVSGMTIAKNIKMGRKTTLWAF